MYFFYFNEYSGPKDKESYWRETSARWAKNTERFLDAKKAMQREVASLVSASDSNDAKLQKIYARVQKIRNLSYEETKTEKEAEKQRLQENLNVEDVLKNGYGYHNEINRTFVALVRAAGFEAKVVRVAERDDKFFQANILSFDQFDNDLAVVKLNGTECVPVARHAVLRVWAFAVGRHRSDQKGCRSNGLTPKKERSTAFGNWTREVVSKSGEISISRTVAIDGLLFRLEWYPELQQFFNALRVADNDQIIASVPVTAGR